MNEAANRGPPGASRRSITGSSHWAVGLLKRPYLFVLLTARTARCIPLMIKSDPAIVMDLRST
jgi:hypothetical protein